MISNNIFPNNPSKHYCMFLCSSTDHIAAGTREFLRSACKSVPGVCVVQPAAWPAKCFGRTELKRKDRHVVKPQRPYKTLKEHV